MKKPKGETVLLGGAIVFVIVMVLMAIFSEPSCTTVALHPESGQVNVEVCQ